MLKKLLTNPIFQLACLLQVCSFWTALCLMALYRLNRWRKNRKHTLKKRRHPRPSWPPFEIVKFHLVPLLSPNDIANLYEALHLEITKDLYEHVFHDNTHFDHYTPQLFRERARCRLYVIGDRRNTDLGLCSEYPVLYESHDIWDGRLGKMLTFGMVDCTDSAITRVSTSPQSMEIVTYDGRLRSTKHTWTNRDVSEITARQNRSDTSSDGMPKVFRRYLDLPLKPTHIVETVSSPSEVIGLDATGMLWHWYKNNDGSFGTGMPFFLKDSRTKRVISGPIRALRNCEPLNGCIVAGTGIVCWPVHTQIPEPQCWRNGYPCLEKGFLTIEATVLPDTNQHIIDFAILFEMVVYLDWNRAVNAVDAYSLMMKRGTSTSCVYSMNDANRFGPFAHVTASDHCILLLREMGYACKLSFEYDFRTGRNTYRVENMGTEIPNVVAVASSGTTPDVHNLLLTQDGDVYSWGRESGNSGCLGLGTLTKELMAQGVRTNPLAHSSDLEAPRPVKLNLPGKVYGIFTGVGYSVVLMVNKEECYNTVRTTTSPQLRMQVSIEGTAVTCAVSKIELGALSAAIPMAEHIANLVST